MRNHQASFHILGAVRARVDDAELKIAAPRQRALLARLLLASNQTVTTCDLIEAIWGDAPPQHPESALHIVVSRLRRALGDLAPRLVRERAGYQMLVDGPELDLARAQSHCSDAQRASAYGNSALAAQHYDHALRCWTGQPLADVADFPFCAAATAQLRELRVGLVELRNTAYLQCGRELDVLADCDTWIRSEPWRERLRAQQMVALYRCGRQIDALAAYDELRALLLDDFGVDPCDEVQRLYSRILRQDPSLVESRPPAPDARALAGPAADRGHRACNEALLARLRAAAIDPLDAIIVEGGPELGKDWLVVALPHRTPEAPGAADALADDLSRMPLADSLTRIRELLALEDRRAEERAAPSLR